MGKYNTLSFQKSSIIYIKNQYPKDSFYVITKGKAISYGTFDYNIEFNKGNILGLVNAVLNEPYFYNVKAVEDTEVMEIKIEDIVNIESKDLMVKIDRYLDTSLEMWLSKYYMSLSNNHNNSIFISSKDDVLKMAEVYKKNGFDDASYKLYKKCIELFPESENEIKNQLSSLTPISEPTAMGNNTFSYKKGYCIYTELEASNKLYIIQSGKVGIYNIINSHQITRAIYSESNIIDGYKPIGKYQALSTSAIILEDSLIKVLEREELLKFGTENALKKMIEVLDNFERGQKALENVEDCEKVKESFNLVHKQVVDALTKLGLEPIETEGKEFDPNFHDAVMQTPTSEKPEHTIINELQKGYKLGDKVLRPTLVNVAVSE